MKKLFPFLYQFLFVDQKTKTISHTKFFSVIGYGIMSWSFVFVISEGKTEVDYMLWLLFGGVVIGNRALIKAITIKND